MNGHEEFLLAARAQGHVLEPAEASEAKRILLEALHRLGVPALRSAVCHAWEVIKGILLDSTKVTFRANLLRTCLF